MGAGGGRERPYRCTQGRLDRLPGRLADPVGGSRGQGVGEDEPGRISGQCGAGWTIGPIGQQRAAAGLAVSLGSRGQPD